jgi:hypothetical protein
MHLTNYAINKDSENYIPNSSGGEGEGVGSKRSLQSIYDIIEREYGTPAYEDLKNEIHDIILKSICMVQPHVNHLIRSC